MIRPDFRYFSIHEEGIIHYGMPRRSGRYPWGSGDRPYQNSDSSIISSKKTIEIKDFNDVKNFNDNLNSWDYGVLINDKKETNPNNIDWTKYKTTPINKIEKYKVGVCWDFVNYQHHIFKQNGIKDESYLFVTEVGDSPNNLVTHTFSIINYDKKKYWFESSWMKNQGIHEIKNYSDVIKKLQESYGEWSYDVYMYNPENLDKGLTNSEFFKKATKNIIETKEIHHSQEGEVKFKMNDLYYISHGGPGSGRYPLGSGDRPYQKFEGHRRVGGGIGGYIRSRKAKKLESDLERRNKSAAEKRAKEQEKLRQLNEEKDKLLKSGKASEILKYQGMWTNAELGTVVSRLNYEKSLKEYSQSEIQSNMAKVDKIMNNLKTVNNWASIGTDTYNMMASIYNATPQGKNSPLTMVQKPNQGGGGQPGKKKK